MGEGKIVNSESIQKELNEARRKKGLPEIPAINPRGAGTSTLARKDKSWSNILDFFCKLIKQKN